METGLEEFGPEDIVIPRLNIEHKEVLFKDSLSGQTFNPITVILLGLVKQRVLWHFEVGEGNDLPMCKSTNHDEGYPNYSEDVPREKRFPWKLAGFDPDDYNLEETVVLPCEKCVLKEWDSAPDGKHPPYCTEQYTFPLLFDPFNNDKWLPAIASFQRTQLRPLKGYLSSFVRGDEPLFTAMTEIRLKEAKRGTNVYSIPSFTMAGHTDRKRWPEWSETFTQIKGFLKQPPTRQDEPLPEPSDNVARPPETQPEAQKQEADPWASPPKEGAGDADDLPF